MSWPHTNDTTWYHHVSATVDAASATYPGEVADEHIETMQRAMLTLTSLGATLSERIGAAVGEQLTGNGPVAVLLHLDVHGPTRPTEFRDLLAFSSGGVSRLLERLEGEALITRSLGSVAGDRRAVVVSLTAKGRRTARRIAAAAISSLTESPALVSALEDLLTVARTERPATVA
jgi:DNA-binding MarR family transcriptional regulator